MNKRRLLIEKCGDGELMTPESLEKLGFIYTSYDTLRNNELIIFHEHLGYSLYVKQVDGSKIVDLTERTMMGSLYTINDFKREMHSYFGIKSFTKYENKNTREENVSFAYKFKRAIMFFNLKKMFK